MAEIEGEWENNDTRKDCNIIAIYDNDRSRKSQKNIDQQADECLVSSRTGDWPKIINC